MKKIQNPSSYLHSQRGSAIIEFLLAALPILLLGLGATETARWYIHKQHIRFALHEAQRVASVTHAEPGQLINAFEEALKPLFAPAGLYKSTEARRDAYLDSVSKKTAMPPWRISITSPTSKHFKDFQQHDLAIAQSSGLAAINNNYQFEQHQEKALGLQSQETIYQANIFSVTLIYPYKPLVPGVNTLMKQLSHTSRSTLKQSYYSNGYLPLEITAHIAMQSHPVQWPNKVTSKIIYHEQITESDKALANPTPFPESNNLCAGLWCADTSSERANQTIKGDISSSSTANTSQSASSIQYDSYQPPQSSLPTHNDPSAELQNTWAPENAGNHMNDDALCSTSLCCS